MSMTGLLIFKIVMGWVFFAESLGEKNGRRRRLSCSLRLEHGDAKAPKAVAW